MTRAGSCGQPRDRNPITILEFVEPVILPAVGEQYLVGTFFEDLSVSQDDNAFQGTNRVESVGDHD